MKYLYKYSNIENAKKALEGQYIFLSSPENFNDIYDSSFGFKLDDLKKVIIGEIASRVKIGEKSYIDLAKKNEIFSNIKTDTSEERYYFIDLFLSEDYFKFLENFGESNSGELFDKLLNKITEITGLNPTTADIELLNKMKEFNYTEFISNFINDKHIQIEQIKKLLHGCILRIGCLSEVHNSNYMWALYANNFNGVCLEYDFQILNKETKKDLHKITYSSDRPVIEKEVIFRFLDDNVMGEKKLEENILKTLTTKNIEFKNENEWRIIKSNANNYFKTKALKRILLGVGITNYDRDIFKNYARKYNIEIYELDYRNDSYTIEFSKIEVE